MCEALYGNGYRGSPSLDAFALEPVVTPGRPPVVEVSGNDSPADWVTRYRYDLQALVIRHGAVLVRGLGVYHVQEVSKVRERLMPDVMVETEAVARRRVYGDGVVSSSEWPADRAMVAHNELSYALEFPRLMLFVCLGEPVRGGVTTLADTSAVLEALPAELVSRFERVGWSVTRNYTDLVGLPWPEAFGTEDPVAVEEYCVRNGSRYEWFPDGSLYTSQRRSAIVKHPVTGSRCWFNQIALLNQWSLDETIRDYLMGDLGADRLPFNTTFGDGEPIDADTVRTITDVYQSVAVSEPWQRGDLLIVDNIRMAHGRESYEGDRSLAVVMAGRVRLVDCAPTVNPMPSP